MRGTRAQRSRHARRTRSVRGVRAAPLWSDAEARLSREHNDANVATFGARLIDDTQASELLDVFLNTEFSGGRHARRIAKIAQLEHSS